MSFLAIKMEIPENSKSLMSGKLCKKIEMVMDLFDQSSEAKFEAKLKLKFLGHFLSVFQTINFLNLF